MLQGIVFEIYVLVLLCVALAVFFIRCSFAHYRKRGKRICSSPESPAEEVKNFPVRYLSERNSHAFWKLLPWDASGVLSTDEEGFSFHGSSPLGRKLDMDFNFEKTKINYQKGSMFWDGGLAWCVIEADGEKHYFTSETSEYVQETAEDEAAIPFLYRQLTDRYLREN